MPSRNETRKPRAADLGALLERLEESGVEFILVGGLAAVVQGVPITTMDMDIVHRQTKANIDNLLKFLESVDACHRRPDDKILAPEERDLSGHGHALFATRLGPLDVLAFIEENQGYEDLVKDTVEIKFRGHSVRILKLEKLVSLKRHSGNPKDLQRLPVLEEALAQLMRRHDSDR